MQACFSVTVILVSDNCCLQFLSVIMIEWQQKIITICQGYSVNSAR